jgi:hypothetical protein
MRDIFPVGSRDLLKRQFKNLQYLNVNPNTEGHNIFANLLLTVKLLRQSLRMPDDRPAPSHQVFAILGETINLLRALRLEREEEFRKLLVYFDVLIVLYTECIKEIPMDVTSTEGIGIYSDILEAPRGILFVDLDFEQIKSKGFTFNVVGIWVAGRDTGIALRATITKILNNGPGFIGIELPTAPEYRSQIRLAHSWDTFHPIVITMLICRCASRTESIYLQARTELQQSLRYDFQMDCITLRWADYIEYRFHECFPGIS